ncbi:MAG: VanZ family protein [Pyrinomonadaceae bacterium]
MNELSVRKWRKWLTAYAPLFVWTVLVLGLGTGMASMSETSRIVRPLLEFLFPSADLETIKLYHTIVRKLAHVFEYGLLGVLAMRAFSAERHRPLRSVVLVILIAILDEFNQSYNPARTSTGWDVIIDGVSGSLGVFAYGLVRQKINRPPARPDDEIESRGAKIEDGT